MSLSRRDLLLATAGVLLTRGARADDAGTLIQHDPTNDIDALLAEVARARSGLHSLTGPFTQERTIGLLSSKIRSTGTLTLVRPDRLRWELASPDDVVYWIGPEGVAYKSAHGQGRLPTTSGRIAAALDDIRVLLGGDLSQLRARYDLRLVSRESSREPGSPVFEATPRPGSGTKVDKLTFALAPDLVSPRSATMIEGPRDKTEIVFGTLARDTKIDPARMRPPF
ncbi:MAG: outer membrane lipoprotein carrier protein LolA [Polyangiaceae bacterium]